MMWLFLILLVPWSTLIAWAFTGQLPGAWLVLRRWVDHKLGVGPIPTKMKRNRPTRNYVGIPQGPRMTYEDAGVSRDRAFEAVSTIKTMTRDTHTPAVTLAEFAGIYEFDKAHHSLIASTDGVGTKTRFLMERMDSPEEACNVLGRDIVHHSVNDILVHGGRPLFFLDYIAAGRIDPLRMSTLVAAMANACKSHGCVILGGETAEMPSVYTSDLDLEIVGTIVGEVRPGNIIDGSAVREGDIIYGIASSGPHTNGYSLLAKLYPPGDDALVDFPELFAPHRSYFPDIYPLLENTKTQPIHGLVHVTGGGWNENTARILKHSECGVAWEEFPFSPLYEDIKARAKLTREEMMDTFNCGFGMLVIGSPDFIPPGHWARVGSIERRVP